MSEFNNNWTRRHFLKGIGAAGGSTALFGTMTALGLINLPPAWAGPPNLPQDSGRGKTVIILGAGIAGLTTAFRLSLAGYPKSLKHKIELEDVI